jgi:large subunit ribosomal protein L15
MISLNQLTNATRKDKSLMRVGRGPGSGKGKTCGRGEKGMGSRSGNNKRLGYEGGQFRTFMKFPIRGFSRARFQKKLDSINLEQIELMYKDGETVNMASLKEHGFIGNDSHGIKILGNGELKKKVTIEATAISASASEKLTKAGITFSLSK